jgi:hypothetical protein
MVVPLTADITRKNKPQSPSQWALTASSASSRPWAVVPFSRRSCAGRQPCPDALSATLISYVQLYISFLILLAGQRVVSISKLIFESSRRAQIFNPHLCFHCDPTSSRFRPHKKAWLNLRNQPTLVPHEHYTQISLYCQGVI